MIRRGAFPNAIGTVLGRARYLSHMRPLARTLCLCLLLSSTGIQAQQYGLRTFSLEEGLPSASVNGLCEDRDGFLWIATDAGAARSEGLHFQTFGRQQGLSTDDVTAVYAARDGRVWLGCRNGAIAYWCNGDLNVLPVDAGLPAAAIRGFAEDAAGELWYATLGSGMVKLSKGKAMTSNNGLSALHIRALVSDPQGRLIVGTDSGLHALNGSKWVKVSDDPSLRGRGVTALFADDLGVLVGTASGFVELTGELKLVPRDARFAGIFPLALPDPRVLSLLRIDDNELWVGTPSGLAHLTRQGGNPELRIIAEANGLGHDVVRAIIQDRSGGIWAGTAFGGISKFTSDAFVHFTERDGLRSRIVTAIHRTPDDLLWLGTMGGGVACWRNGEVRSYGRAEGLSDPMVLSFGEDAEGYLLVGTTTHGLFRMDGERFDRYPPRSGLGSDRIFCIHRSVDGSQWVGGDKGLYKQMDRERFLRLAGATFGVHGLASTNDTLWAATEHGLYHVALNSGSLLFQRNSALPAVNMTSIARDSHGNLWVGTAGHGLYRLQGTRVDSLNAENGLASHAVEQVLLDAYENVWLGTRRGVHLLELDVMQERIIHIQHYGVEEGFIGVEAFRNACMLDHDSTLWFGSVRGATQYDPQREVIDAREPIIHLTDLQLFFERPDWSTWSTGIDRGGMPEGLQLPYNKNHLTFAFTGISLAYPEKVRYRYLLEGYDPDWSPITALDRVTYSNIPPGEYHFRVMARNSSGIWTEEPVSYTFRIDPPFWATWPFRAAAIAAIALGLFGFIRMREQRSRRERARLERMVTVRTQQLALEKDRSDALLLNILPASTAEELKTKGTADARSHPHCTVLFSDFTGFTTFSSRMDSSTLVAELDHYFRLFDHLCDRYGVEKIKTIGDAYMCASGLPDAKRSHALDAVIMALGMVDAVARSNSERSARNAQQWPVRIGLHSGPVVSGVVGQKKFAYDIWGDTVNLASRMESNSEPGRVNISGSTYSEVMDYVDVVPRGPVKVKGKGEHNMYFVLRLKAEWSADAEGLQPNAALMAERDRVNV
jgi:ligand-binding sensor domain-containing protein/class 3 adenylate cyclase